MHGKKLSVTFLLKDLWVSQGFFFPVLFVSFKKYSGFISLAQSMLEGISKVLITLEGFEGCFFIHQCVNP